MKTITQSLKTVALASILALGVSYVSAWTVPTVAPPGGNTAAPLNTSANTQYKAGTLGVDLFRSFGNLIVDGSMGVGTATPGARLESKAPTTGAYNTAFRGVSNDGTKTIDLNIQNDGTANLGGNFTNFGIGTATPDTKLKVAGDIKTINMVINGYRLNVTPTINYGSWQPNWLCCGGGPGYSDTCNSASTAIYSCSGAPRTCIDTANQEQVTGDTGCQYCGKVGGYYRDVDCGTTAAVSNTATWVGQ